eukprot:366200-Chlamydomonas_euryale.AAC.13
MRFASSGYVKLAAVCSEDVCRPAAKPGSCPGAVGPSAAASCAILAVRRNPRIIVATGPENKAGVACASTAGLQDASISVR